MATFSEKCAHTSRKYLTEEVMSVVKWSENHNHFLSLEELPVASFCKICALIPRKYMAE